MSARTRELVERRVQLQRRSAEQRQIFAREARSIEQRLHAVERVVSMTRRVVAEPLVLVGLAAGVVFVGPLRVMRMIGRSLLVAEALRRLWSLLRR